ncbi:translesion DNA synthesis-associated protein ImuA [Methyloversatilis sp.]|uniref:translesion DNA synthesis-associated protein ImuA n=1 Tax=Methyloversatilis sp. TaxID=2569862 RepID=UPI0035B22793
MVMRSEAMETARLLQRPDLWRANDLVVDAHPGLPTGYAALDEELPGGGWPVGELTELLGDDHGCGEVSLLLPTLARISRNTGWVIWVAPPARLNLPALAAAGVITPRMLMVDANSPAECAWALRQGLESGACTALMGWLDTIDGALLRRLQLAARETSVPVFLFRPARSALSASPAPLRLQLSAGPEQSLRIEILKRRGRPASQPVCLYTRPALPASPTVRIPRTALTQVTRMVRTA